MAPRCDYLRRSDVTWDGLGRASPRRRRRSAPTSGRQVEVRAKYQGYIARQDKQIERFAQMEQKLIPHALDYASVVGLRNEAQPEAHASSRRAASARPCASAASRPRT